MEDRAILDQVNIVARDIGASAAFYRLLGVEVPNGEPPWDAHHRSVSTSDGADIDLDSTQFAAVWDTGWADGRTGVVLGFKVESREAVDRVHAAVVAAGHRSEQDPYDAFWGARYAVVADPDGNAVGIMSPIDDTLRTPPPAPDSFSSRQ